MSFSPDFISLDHWHKAVMSQHFNFFFPYSHCLFWTYYCSLSYPANIKLFKVNKRNPREPYRNMFKLMIIKTPERRHWHSIGAFIANFGYILHLLSSVYIFGFELKFVYWIKVLLLQCRYRIVKTIAIYYLI